MDLGITGRKALVCGGSSGLGFACAQALLAEGVEVVIVARTESKLRDASARLSIPGMPIVQWVVADITHAGARDDLFKHHPEFDILVTNASGPPPGDFRHWNRDAWLRALDTNMLAPIELIKAVLDGMMRRGFGRIVNITSSGVKAPLQALGLSNGARSGLTGFVAGLARSTVASGVTINNLLPGAIDTARLASNFAARAQREGKTTEAVVEARLREHPAARFGRPEEVGHACAFLCSAHAGYINGQNLLIDGGSYLGVF